jgi:L-ascorbate metabolism protein UlaG (beta-lactamase superfamily)
MPRQTTDLRTGDDPAAGTPTKRLAKRRILRPWRIVLALLAALASLCGGLWLHALAEFGATPTEAEEGRYAALRYWSKDRRRFQAPGEQHFLPDRVQGAGSGGWFLRFVAPDPNAPRKPLPTVALGPEDFGEPAGDIAARWLGHSALILEIAGRRILVDPVFGNAAPIPGVVRRYVDSPLRREDIPKIDVVLITHDHYDHLEYATMRHLRERDALFVCPLGVGAHLRRWGVPDSRIRELAWGETLDLKPDGGRKAGGLAITAERTIHFSGRTWGTRDRSLWACYAIRGGDRRVFVSGDGGYGPHFEDFGRRHGPFDLAFVEIDGWNAGWPGTHMFPEEVVQAVRDLRAKAFVPVHWGVFDLALHPWDESIRMVADLMDEAAWEAMLAPEVHEDGEEGAWDGLHVKLLTPMMGELVVPGRTATERWWERTGR